VSALRLSDYDLAWAPLTDLSLFVVYHVQLDLVLRTCPLLSRLAVHGYIDIGLNSMSNLDLPKTNLRELVYTDHRAVLCEQLVRCCMHSLESCGITSPGRLWSALTQCPRLRSLNLGKISEFGEFRGTFKTLEDLKLRDCDLTEAQFADVFGRCLGLKRLEVDYCPNLSKAMLEATLPNTVVSFVDQELEVID
jgi:hypothetical protein